MRCLNFRPCAQPSYQPRRSVEWWQLGIMASVTWPMCHGNALTHYPRPHIMVPAIMLTDVSRHWSKERGGWVPGCHHFTLHTMTWQLQLALSFSFFVSLSILLGLSPGLPWSKVAPSSTLGDPWEKTARGNWSYVGRRHRVTIYND